MGLRHRLFGKILNCGVDPGTEHVSGAERRVLPLRIKPDFSDLRSPLRSRSAAPRSRSAPLRSIFLRPAHRSAPLHPSFGPLRSVSAPLTPVINSVANSGLLGLRVALFYSVLW